MTYALSWPLQQGVFVLLSNDPGVAARAGGRVHDAPPPPEAEADPDGVYITLGDETARDWSTATDHGAVHLVTISVHAPRRGFAAAKQAAGAVSDALLGGTISLSRGRVVLARFVEARTRREENGALRRIEMRFRISVEDTA
jgi:hypothetical protein